MILFRDERSLRLLSNVLGWIYVLAWSVSFYPQPLLNWRRRSTIGLTADYPALNVLGFVSYTTLTSCFLFSKIIREQYAQRHPLSPEPTVRFNDLAFAIHALVLVFFTYSQLWPQLWSFEVSGDQRTSTIVRAVVLGSIAAVIVSSVGASSSYFRAWEWMDVIYMFGHIKLITTFVKYVPQVWSNYQRQSTLGWSIWQVLFDITGGVLSLTQLLIDASLQNDWSGVQGNAVKFGLGGVSVFFDIILIVQHYILYGDRSTQQETEVDSDTETQPLLHATDHHHATS